MHSALKCLRCSSEMELGNLSNQDTPHLYMWSIHDPDLPSPLGFMLLRGETGKRKRAAFERVKRSLTKVQAYRCVKCGSVELNASRNAGDDT